MAFREYVAEAKQQMKFDTKLITSLRKNIIDASLKKHGLNPKFRLLDHGIEMNFKSGDDLEGFEDDFYNYLEDNDVDVSWGTKKNVITIKTYAD